MTSKILNRRTIAVAVLGALLLAAGAAWLLIARSSHSEPHVQAASGKAARYQCPMHPWVQSDRPGKCTVCGMDLVAFDQRPGASAAATDIVMLPESAPNVANIRTAEVQRRSLARSLHVAGMIEDDDSKHRILSAFTGGRIEKLFVNYEGADVQAGQPIATFYSNDLLAAIREYKVAYAQGPSPLLTATRVRLQQLGLSPDQIAKAHQRSEAEVFVEILAPVSGTVVKRYVYEGQYVEEGEKLFEIADFSTMWFQFVAYEQDLPLLKIGQKVTVRTPSLPEKTFQAAITFINPNLDAATRSARVRVEIENPGRELRHKLYAEGTVEIDAPEVVAVPRTAVVWPGNNPRVYVEQAPGVYQQRAVILGRPGDDFWEILEGVKPGERVVTSGNMLIDGQAQLSNVSAAPEGSPPPQRAALSPGEHGSLGKFFQAVAELSDALARDDLGAFNALLPRIRPTPPELAPTLPAPPQTAPDLSTARRTFLPFSEAVAEYAMQVRSQFPELKVFRCPMSDAMGEDAPKNAKWVQFSDRLRNPFMGQEMVECGTEVK